MRGARGGTHQLQLPQEVAGSTQKKKGDLTKEQNFSVLNVFNIKAPKLGGLRFVILTLKVSNETLDTLITTRCV